MPLTINSVYQLDAIEFLNSLEAESVDLLLADLPYGNGITSCAWDKVIDLNAFWPAVYRVVKQDSAIVLNAMQPFTTQLINSNPKGFKYNLVWNKKFAGNFNNAKYRPMATYEDIVIFCKGKKLPRYYPQMVKRDKPIKGGGFTKSGAIQQKTLVPLKKDYDYKYPVGILEFPRPLGRSLHPTQKPLELFEYLIKTYSKEGDLVIDPTVGSGTTALAALNTGRNFIVNDLSPEYVEVTNQRIAGRDLSPVVPATNHDLKLTQLSFME